jgi:phosphoenolpyruvate---glycerone phosphotransferase subunit DhaL
MPGDAPPGLVKKKARGRQEPAKTSRSGPESAGEAWRCRSGRSYTRPAVSHAAPVSAARSELVIDGAAVRAALARCEWLIGRHAAYLTRLDAVLGDGDHGDNLVIGFRAVREMLAELPADASPGELLRAVGHRLVGAVGGASGPLYGTAFLEAGAQVGDSPTLSLDELGPMFQAAADGLARRGRCTVGDKTILDTLAPAAETLQDSIASGVNPVAAYGLAVRAAAHGMYSTRPMVARRGLAMRLGERARGHLDPGSVSCLLLLRAIGGG